MLRDRYNFFPISPTEWRYEIFTPTKHYDVSYKLQQSGFVCETLKIGGVLQFTREFNLLSGPSGLTIADIVEKDGAW
jgi:hypothetical protein